MLQAALEYRRAGNLAQAEALCHEILKLEPDRHDVLFLMGGLAFQTGQYQASEDFIRKAVRANPSSAVYQSDLALALEAQGKYEEAASNYRKALSLKPDLVMAHNNIGNVLLALGKSDEAIVSYRKAIKLKPDYTDALCNLGVVLKGLGRHDEALGCYRKALSFKQDAAEVHYNIGSVLQAQNQFDEAIGSYRKALSFRPAYPEAYYDLGIAFHAQGKLDVAIESYRKALSLKPEFAQANNNLGNLFLEQDNLEAAFECYRKALSSNPELPQAQYNLGNVLMAQDRLDEAADAYRKTLSLEPDNAEAYCMLGIVCHLQRKTDEANANLKIAISYKPEWAEALNDRGVVLRDLGKLDEAMGSFRKALSINQDFPAAHSNLLLAMQFDPDAPPDQLLAEHLKYAARFEAPLTAERLSHSNTKEPDRRLRIGYVSPDFRNHAVAYFFEPILENHDREHFEIFCYYNNNHRDEYTDRIIAHSDHWLPCRKMGDAELAERIKADGIDILIDLAGHTVGNRLGAFARKPAPIQITYLGYPGTSGLSAVDYRLTDNYADPPGSEIYYTEKLLRLPDSLCCYKPQDMSAILPLPALQNGHITFGSFNNFNKIDHTCIELWARLLLAVPNSRMMMLTIPEGASRQRIQEQFATLDVAPERLEFRGFLPKAEFRQMFQQIDIALDPIAVTGGTTTCETLWMGVPVIILAGPRYITRVGYSFLSAAGMQEFAAATPEEYIAIAVRLANDIPQLAKLHAGMRSRVAASPLVDEERFTRNLEKIYREVWIEWCDKPSCGAT